MEVSADEQSEPTAADKRRVRINIAAFLINFIGVGLVNLAGTFVGKNIAEVSGTYPTLFTPALWAFSIWGIIYTGETVFTLWQALPKNAGKPLLREGLGYWWAAASILQALWTIAFAKEWLVVSTLLLVATAACLGIASIRLAPYRRGETKPSEYLLVHATIGLHAGWVAAAALVNVNLPFVGSGAGIATQVTVAIVSVFAAAALAAFQSIACYDRAYLAAVTWALLGVAANSDYKVKLLGEAVAAGFSGAISAICISLAALEAGMFVWRRTRKDDSADSPAK